MRQGIGRLLARTVLWPIIILRRQIPPPVVVGIGSFCGHNFLCCLFSSVQWLRFCRGERRCANRPSGRRLRVESMLSLFASKFGRKGTKKKPNVQIFLCFEHKKRALALGVLWFLGNMPRYEMAIWRPVLPSSRLIFGRSMVRIPSSTFALIFASSTLSGKVYFCSKLVYANSRLK